MRQLARPGLVALMVAALSSAAVAQAPPAAPKPAQAPKAAPPAQKGAAPAQKAAAPAPKAASPTEILATVNGDKITRGEVIEFMSQYGFQTSSEEDTYDITVKSLVNLRLLTQFLNKKGVKVADKEIDAEVAKLRQELQADGSTLEAKLVESNTSMEELRGKIRERRRWINYMMSQATDAALKKFAAENKDLLSGAEVCARHIFLDFDEGAPAAEKDKVRRRMLEIKKEIDDKTITFEEAANKYSQDRANVQQKNGGDLGCFPRRGVYIEEFATAAFALKKDQVSDPVETPVGYHLIQVYDRREGKPIDLQTDRNQVLQFFAADLQERVIADERKTAKVDIKPMPADLFQSIQPEPAAPAPAAAPAPKAAAPR